MRTFRPVFADRGDPAGSLDRLQQAIDEAAHRADPFVEMQVLHAEPVRVRAGMYVTADGVDWNPGSGEGLYRRNAANSAWVFIG